MVALRGGKPRNGMPQKGCFKMGKILKTLFAFEEIRIAGKLRRLPPMQFLIRQGPLQVEVGFRLRQVLHPGQGIGIGNFTEQHAPKKQKLGPGSKYGNGFSYNSATTKRRFREPKLKLIRQIQSQQANHNQGDYRNEKHRNLVIGRSYDFFLRGTVKTGFLFMTHIYSLPRYHSSRQAKSAVKEKGKSEFTKKTHRLPYNKTLLVYSFFLA